MSKEIDIILQVSRAVCLRTSQIKIIYIYRLFQRTNIDLIQVYPLYTSLYKFIPCILGWQCHPFKYICILLLRGINDCLRSSCVSGKLQKRLWRFKRLRRRGIECGVTPFMVISILLLGVCSVVEYGVTQDVDMVNSRLTMKVLNRTTSKMMQLYQSVILNNIKLIVL